MNCSITGDKIVVEQHALNGLSMHHTVLLLSYFNKLLTWPNYGYNNGQTLVSCTLCA